MPVAYVSICLGLTLATLAVVPARAADACCSCETQLKEMFTTTALPCAFDVPQGWKVTTGDDGAAVMAIAGAQCAAACPVSGGLSLSVAKKPNANAESMEQLWRQVMQSPGSARCGDAAVTFYTPPGTDPNAPWPRWGALALAISAQTEILG